MGDWPLCRCPGGGVTGRQSLFLLGMGRPDLPKHPKFPVVPFPVVGGKYQKLSEGGRRVVHRISLFVGSIYALKNTRLASGATSEPGLREW